jgi:twitching motility protein PilT
VQYHENGMLAILMDSRHANASDVLLKVPGPPMFRINGELVPTPYPPMRPDDTHRAARALLAMAQRDIPLQTFTEYEFSFGVQPVGRFRAHLYRQRGSIAVSIHRMAIEVPSLQSLGTPPEVSATIRGEPGLVLVTGGRKRLELMAAMVDDYNHGVAGHMVSLEDPLEYLHEDDVACISQREVGTDTPSYHEGLQAAMREDPDAIMLHDVPEMRVAELALRAAESGRQVLAGVAECRLAEATRWFTRLFAAHRESEIAGRLAGAVRGVISESHGRVQCVPPTDAVVDAIQRVQCLPAVRSA